MMTSRLRSARFLAIVVAPLLGVACGGSEFNAAPDESGGGSASGNGTSAGSHAGASEGGRIASLGSGGAGSDGGGDAVAGSVAAGSAAAGGAAAGSTSVGGAAAGSTSVGGAAAGAAGAAPYLGPSVGDAKPFAALAYSAITAANISQLVGGIGVSAGAASTITGFDAPTDIKYGTDSLPPNTQLTSLAQQAVTALVGNINPRACDADYTNVATGLTGDITLYPGVTCMNSFANDVLVNGHITLDARGDSNAYFIIRGNLTLTIADAAQVVLKNGAQSCGVFWRIAKQVTIGKAVQFYGTVIAGSAIVMNTGSTLVGRALAQTAGVHLDANAITIPNDGPSGSVGSCSHLQ